MCCENNCYFCKNLCFVSNEAKNDYYCMVTGKLYRNIPIDDCNNFILELEE